MLLLSRRTVCFWSCLFLATLMSVVVGPASAVEKDDQPAATEKHDAPAQSDKAQEDASDSEAKESEPAATRPSLGQLKERLAERAKQPAEEANDAKEPEKAKEPAKATEPEKAEPDKAMDDKAKPEAEKPSPKAAPAKEEPKREKKAEPAKKAESEKKAEPAKKTITVADFTLRGEYPEGPTQAGLFGEMQSSLDGIIDRLDAAAEDDAVAAVVLRIESLGIGRGKLEELRAAVARIRDAGKPVWAVLTSAEPAEYLVASACNRIVMPESGMLMVPGVRAEMTFYKGLFDKLGIQFQMLQMGKYKGAAEPYSRTEMSEPLRESLDALVDDTYELLVETIAADRDLKDYEVKTLLDVGLFTAKAAVQAKLVDELVYADQIKQRLERELKADQINLVTNYHKKKVETNFSGITGMMKLFEMMMGGKPAETGTAAKKIAVVYAVGPIMEGKNSSDLFGSQSIGSTTMVEALRTAAGDDKVAAIVLRIDSPGGSAIASDLIWRETIRIEKPIIASMGDVAGSGGYYIAMGADKIFAEPGTVTGSIGVVGGKVVLGGLYDKIGLTTEIISRGRNTGIFSSTEAFTPEQEKALTANLREIYRQFVAKAAKGRKMEVKKLDELAQGRLYTGRMAVELGLIDQLGTLADAVAAAKQAAGIEAGEKVDILMLPRPKTLFEQLFEDPAAMNDVRSFVPELTAPMLARIALIRRLFTEPALVWMPYDITVK